MQSFIFVENKGEMTIIILKKSLFYYFYPIFFETDKKNKNVIEKIQKKNLSNVQTR